MIGSNKLVFDIGANIGEKTRIFNKLRNKVVAVEPQNDLCQNLKKRFAEKPEVIIEHAGVSNQEGELILNISSKYHGFSSFDEHWQEGTKYHCFDRQEKVRITTLDKLIEKYGLPYFCKIDVEGYELEVLKGLSRKIPYISFEFHSENFNLAEKSLDILKTLGYKRFNYEINERTEFAMKQWVGKTELVEKIKSAMITNTSLWGDIFCR